MLTRKQKKMLQAISQGKRADEAMEIAGYSFKPSYDVAMKYYRSLLESQEARDYMCSPVYLDFGGDSG